MLAVLGTSLGGCILEIPTPTLDVSKGVDKMPLDETGPWTYRDPTEKELLLARSDFSVEVVRFTDSRRPRSMEGLSKEQIIYEYDPERLLGGVTYSIPTVLGKYLSYRPKTPKHYKVEIDVKKLQTFIKSGSFWSGRWGRYYVAMEMQVIARRPDSTVALMKTYRLEDAQRREDFDGRGPSKERDRMRMYDLSESMLRKMAENIGWDLRMRDARHWKVEQPQTLPAKLNMPPVDNVSGSAEDDVAPLTIPAAIPAVPIQPSTQKPIIPVTPASWTDVMSPTTPSLNGWLDDRAPADAAPAPADTQQDDENTRDEMTIPDGGAIGPVI